MVSAAKEWHRRTQDAEVGVPLDVLLANLLLCAQEDAEHSARTAPTSIRAVFSDKAEFDVSEPSKDLAVYRTLRVCMESLQKLDSATDWWAFARSLSAALKPNSFLTSEDGESSDIVHCAHRRVGDEDDNDIAAIAFVEELSANAKPPQPVFAPAVRVVHAKFGLGTVTRDLGDRAEVRFDDGVTRTLLWRVLVAK